MILKRPQGRFLRLNKASLGSSAPNTLSGGARFTEQKPHLYERDVETIVNTMLERISDALVSEWSFVASAPSP